MINKTLFLVVGLILISRLEMYSQDVTFGIVAGIDVAKSHVVYKDIMAEDDIRHFQPMIGFNVNGMVRYAVSDFIQVSLEPGLIVKGVKIEDGVNEEQFRLTYIQLPILADMNVGRKFYFSVGPELAYQINVKPNTFYTETLYDERFEISGMVGANFKLTDRFDLGLRYSHGLTPASNVSFTDVEGHEVGAVKEYNQYLQLIVKCIL